MCSGRQLIAPSGSSSGSSTVSFSSIAPVPTGCVGANSRMRRAAVSSSRSTRSTAGSTPTASPRLRRRHSAWPPHRRIHSASELTPADVAGCGGHALRPSPYPPDSSRAVRLRGFYHRFTSVPPSDLACRTRLVWQYRSRSGVVGAASRPSRRSPGQAAPSFTTSLRQCGGEVFHLPR